MKYTNASELARLAGLSRERVGQVLERGDVPEAYQVPFGKRAVWRIPVRAANRWLRGRGVTPPTWVYRGPHKGSLDAVWVAGP